MTKQATGPLAGIRVLDFGHTIMGPCAGLLLADLGADVIKIEPPDGDPTRSLPGFGIGFFATFNRNKRSLAVDLKTEAGLEAVHKLVVASDVVIENYGPGTADRLGIGWDTVKKLNGRLIYLGLKGYLTGPYEQRRALDEVVQMQSGIAYMTGPSGRPLRAGAPIIDVLGAVFGVVGVLSALRERDKTGRGSRVYSALFETAVFLLGPYMAGGAVLGEPLQPMPSRRGAWAIYDVFTCSGGEQFFLGITSNAHWQKLCESFDLSDLAADARLTTNTSRSKERGWLLPHLTSFFQTLHLDEVLSKCEAASLPCARIGRPEDLSTDVHLVASGGLLETVLTQLADGHRIGLPALPIELGENRRRLGLRRQPPAIGEHSEEVLGEVGFSSEEVSGLVSRRVIVTGDVVTERAPRTDI